MAFGSLDNECETPEKPTVNNLKTSDTFNFDQPGPSEVAADFLLYLAVGSSLIGMAVTGLTNSVMFLLLGMVMFLLLAMIYLLGLVALLSLILMALGLPTLLRLSLPRASILLVLLSNPPNVLHCPLLLQLLLLLLLLYPPDPGIS